jgi:hypothetical protein
MLSVVKKYNLMSKEHNGDFLDVGIIKEKFKLGLDSINIAPEFGQIETNVILNEIRKKNPDLINDFFNICYESKKWEKWVNKEFNPFENRIELIKICGHYVFSNEKFKELKRYLSIEIENTIKKEITKKIKKLLINT